MDDNCIFEIMDEMNAYACRQGIEVLDYPGRDWQKFLIPHYSKSVDRSIVKKHIDYLKNNCQNNYAVEISFSYADDCLCFYWHYVKNPIVTPAWQ